MGTDHSPVLSTACCGENCRARLFHKEMKALRTNKLALLKLRPHSAEVEGPRAEKEQFTFGLWCTQHKVLPLYHVQRWLEIALQC